MLEATAGAEQHFFVRVGNPCAEGTTIADLALDDIATMMDVDHDVGDAMTDELRDAVGQDRHAAHRQHRLGPLVGKCTQSRTQPSAEQHGAHLHSS